MRKVLTVCLGNRCRSPFAEIVLARRGGADLEVRSAGLIGKWQGEPADKSMVNAARRLGHDLTEHRGQQITLDMVDWADSILAMDAAILETLRTICGDANTPKLALYLGDHNVPDPIGKDDATFDSCAVLIEAGTALHIQ
ncbi:low molecular weight protein-tyrosine-phosphatase [Streptomyces sp. PTD9-10]|uniref:low molecular weight protein-tyrosine-phosphatase n=1 Tax=Streptomyces sp. PTD9-10 TaxID=3120151 RepID=UPI00300B0087